MTDVLRWATGTPEHQHHPWWAVLIVAMVVGGWVGHQFSRYGKGGPGARK